MTEGYRRRFVRNYFPTDDLGPVNCDCDLLPRLYACALEDLEHTELLAEHEMTAAGLVIAVEIRRCPQCQQYWWAHWQSRTDYTYSREDETRIVGSTTTRISSAVRCDDRAHADALGAWYLEYLSAQAARDRYVRQIDYCGAVESATLTELVAECISLGTQSAAAEQLTRSGRSAVKPSNLLRQQLAADFETLIARIEEQPRNAQTWSQLQALQARCRLARERDPAADGSDWTPEEVWTPHLAGMRRWTTEIWRARQAAKGARLGSPAHLALRRIEDDIAFAWMQHAGVRPWPTREVEFYNLLRHAESLVPGIVMGDVESFAHLDWVCRRIKALVDAGVTPRLSVAPLIAERTGLPDAHVEQKKAIARRGLLDRRRRERAHIPQGSNH